MAQEYAVCAAGKASRTTKGQAQMLRGRANFSCGKKGAIARFLSGSLNG